MFLRLRDVLEITALSRSSLYRYMDSGDFPKQYKLGSRSVAWKKDEVESWISQRCH